MRRRAAIALLPATVLTLGLLPPSSASAQGAPSSGAPPSPAMNITCPPTLKLTYTGVAQLPFPGREFDLSGFTPTFVPVTVRLISAEIAPPADDKKERLSGMAENEMTAKPGQPLIYVIWPKGAKEPEYEAAVSCAYEGGYALQRRLPKTVRTCTLTYAVRQTGAEDTSTRRFYTKADFACR